MPITHDVFTNEVLNALKAAFSKVSNSSSSEPLLTDQELLSLLAQPPEFSLGQLAMPCHTLARKLRLPPQKIADMLVRAVQDQAFTYIAKIQSVTGYVNFHCNLKTYGAHLLGEISGGTFFKKKLLSDAQKEKIVVEFSQPNTHKALHIGHLRNMVYGDAVCNLLDYVGHNVVRTTYPGDLGTHIAKSLWYIKAQKGAQLPASNQADWLGQMYCESDECVTSKKDTPDEAVVKSEIAEVLKSLQARSGDYYQLYLQTREWSLQQMRDTYAWLGIRFDEWYFESECDIPSRDLVLKKFEEGFFVKSDGAIGLDLSAYDLGFALFLKSDGNGLYLTKDLELIRRKFEDPAVTRSIVIVDVRQKLHFKQLFKTAELMGYPQAAKSEHLSYETVTTEDGKPFSSRKLIGMQLHHLRAAMEAKVIKDYLSNYDGQWNEGEIKKTAEAVSLGALKYGFLHVDSGNVIRFVLNDWLRLDGDTGPYLQYVHARCASLLEKVGRAKANTDLCLETGVEQELLYFLSRFNHSAIQAAHSYRPSVVTAYLYDLCKLFNRFYKDCPIKTAEESQRQTRLALVDATATVLKAGLQLLGIPATDRM